MAQPDLERAIQYVSGRLETELSKKLLYHGIAHTRDDVVLAAERLAVLEGVSEEDCLLLKTAAWFHDIGFIERYTDNERISVSIAGEVLPSFGYSPNQIKQVNGIIMATRLPQSPKNLLEEIMCDADLDLLGRDDFWDKNVALRTELELFGTKLTDREWCLRQLEFLRTHHYFTHSAQCLRGAGKERYYQEMAQWLEKCPLQEASTASKNGNLLLAMAERVAILRAVSLFAETPDKTLQELASLLTPVEIPAGQTIFYKGEPGDCLYVIVSGKIRIHDGDLIFNNLGPADVFGEMALLESEPRVASATVLETARLLRLNQGDFYSLMENRPEVARGVLLVLSRRLRGRVRDMKEDFLYIQQVGRVTSASAALEAGLYDPHALDEVSQRTDELGQLARVFQRMAGEVQARERRLKAEVQELRIQIDEAKRATQVAQITESEYFQQLQERVRELRRR